MVSLSIDTNTDATLTAENQQTVGLSASSLPDGSVTKAKFSAAVRAVYEQAANPLGTNSESDSAENIITLATYNILSANYWRWPVNPPCSTDEGLVKACRNIRVANPDIIGMNEIPDNPKYTPLEKLKIVGYDYDYFYGTNVSKFQNCLFGNAIMAKSGYTATSESGATFATYGTQPRCYTNVKFTTPDNNVISVYSTHLGMTSAERSAQVTELKSVVASDSSEYKVVMGDFNIVYGSTEYTNTLDDGWLVNTNDTLGTYISTNALIDYIFHTANMTAMDYGTIENSDASDHRMLWATFTLG